MPVVGNGSQRLAALAVRLKVAGGVTIRRQLLRGLKSAADPLVKEVAEAARQKLPKSGGLNEQVAGQKVKVQVRTGARTASVRLTTDAPDTAQTDAGFVRHPVYANRNVWKTQQIPKAAGWWSKTLGAKGPEATEHLIEAMEVVEGEVQGGL